VANPFNTYWLSDRSDALKINFLMRCFFLKLTKMLKQSAILHFITSGLVFLSLAKLFEKLQKF